MGVVDGIEKSEIRDLLGKGWLTHDGMWFYNTYTELGIEAANRLNKAAIKTLAPVEIARMKKAMGLGRERIGSFDELVSFMPAALELTLPASVFEKFHLTVAGENRICWKWESGQCFAYRGITQIGAIDGYDCGVMYRIECWLRALGIEYEMTPRIRGCLMHQRGACEGEIRVHF